MQEKSVSENAMDSNNVESVATSSLTLQELNSLSSSVAVKEEKVNQKD